MSDQLREALEQRLWELEKPVGWTLDGYDRLMISAYLAPILGRAVSDVVASQWAQVQEKPQPHDIFAAAIRGDKP